MADSSNKPTREQDQQQPLIEHLLELRDRLLRVIVTVLVVFLALFAFANDLYTLLAEPLLRYLPEGATMIATEVASPFLTPFKLTLMLSVYVSIPVILYHLWAFIAPGLYENERKMVYPLLISSTLLFYGGMAFAYYVVFPLVFGFFTSVVPEGVTVMTDIRSYLDFVLSMFLAFGICFEVPIAVILLVWTRVVSTKALVEKRRYVIVGAFVIGMILTPPDVISQTLLAVPLWLLFELGVVVARLYERGNDDEQEEQDEPAEEERPSKRVYSTPTGTQSVNQGQSRSAPRPNEKPLEPAKSTDQKGDSGT